MSVRNNRFSNDKKHKLIDYVVSCGHSLHNAYSIVNIVIYSDIYEKQTTIALTEYRIAWSLIKCGYEYLPEKIWKDTVNGGYISDIAQCLNYLLTPYIEYWNR
jgi:hypothetical protein